MTVVFRVFMYVLDDRGMGQGGASGVDGGWSSGGNEGLECLDTGGTSRAPAGSRPSATWRSKMPRICAPERVMKIEWPQTRAKYASNLWFEKTLLRHTLSSRHRFPPSIARICSSIRTTSVSDSLKNTDSIHFVR